jgi:dienelactone hydrolase
MNTRRGVLVAAGGALAGVAGCLGGGDGDDDTQSNGNQSNGNQSNGNANGDTEPVTDVAESLVEDLSAGAFDEAYQQFSDPARGVTSAGALEATWLGLTNVGGPFEEIVESTQAAGNAADVTLGFERGTHVLRVVVGGERRPRGIAINDEYESPAYVDPEGSDTREITLEADDCSMDGVVTLPDGAAADSGVPGVVLVHGADQGGTADMDLTNGGSAPFRDLGEGLATKGVAVARYDRRTNACTDTIDPATSTLDAVSVDDALLAVERLREADGVDPNRIAVAGLGLGGMAVPRIAQRDGNLAGGIPMAAPARSFPETFLSRFAHLANVGEFEWDRAQQALEQWSTGINQIREGNYQPGDIVLGYPGALWDSIREYDHIGTAQAVETPLLFLQGGRDYQTTVDDDFTVWQSELDGRQTTAFQQYDGLNHRFQDGDRPSVRTEYALRNSVDRAVVTDIADWVSQR